MALIQHAKPIPEVIRDEKTPPRIRELLAQIDPIKKFGEKNGLKPTPNYREYVKLDRPAAVWVVSACEPLRFKSKEWSFPIVGAFPYLGWFDLKAAKEYAEKLKQEGWDVDVRGAGAYSTLGWFRDSILSSMIPSGKEALGDLVNVVLHESVHATVYIPSQAYFNESIASFVADHLTLDYLDQLGPERKAEKEAYLDSEKRSKGVYDRLHQGYVDLDELYRSNQSDAEKLKKKAEIIKQLQEELKLKRPFNNASLVQYKTYHTGSQDFERLFEKCGKNWSKFLGAAQSLKESSFSESQQISLKEPLDRAIQHCQG